MNLFFIGVSLLIIIRFPLCYKNPVPFLMIILFDAINFKFLGALYGFINQDRCPKGTLNQYFAHPSSSQMTL